MLAAPGAMRMHVVMLRDIDANGLGKLFTRGMQDNASREEFSKSISGTLRMADSFSAKKRLVVGDNFSIDGVPGAGTTVLVNGKAQGEPVKEPEFFNALLRIWLGSNPADRLLKDALLGRTGPAPGGSDTLVLVTDAVRQAAPGSDRCGRPLHRPRLRPQVHRGCSHN